LFAWILLWTPLVMAEQRVELEITGIDQELQDNVRAHLGIARLAQQSGLIPFIPAGQDEPAMDITETNVQRLHRQATRDIGAALQPFGYYEPVIDAQLGRDGDTWRAVYAIDTGPATRIGQLDIRISGAGHDDADIDAARCPLPAS
jgi:translocation and assembly module TamA